MDTLAIRRNQVAASKYRPPVCVSLLFLASNEAKARGGGGGAFGFEILFGIAVVFAIWWLIAQVSRETKKQMIFGYVIAAAVVLIVIQLFFNVLS